MALDAGLTIVPGRGHFWLAPVDTPFPTTTATPEAPWEEVGHTQRDTPLQVSFEGGESEVLGSWQDPNLRTRQDPPVRAIAFSLLQYDETGLKLYYGANSVVDPVSGRVQVPKVPSPTEVALFIRVVDGTREQYRYYPRVSILAADSEEFDVEQLAAMPVSATLLGSDGSDFSGEVSPVVDTTAT